MKSLEKISTLLRIQFALILLLCGCSAAQETVQPAESFPGIQETLPPIEMVEDESEAAGLPDIEEDEFLLDYNILEYMKDGLNDPATREIFKEELEPKAIDSEATYISTMQINYFDFDLNDDGLEDKIIILVSGGYSGRAGDTLMVAINTGNGYVRDHTSFSTMAFMRPYTIDQDLAGSVRIMKQKSEGFYVLKIEIKEQYGYPTIYAVYEDGGYQDKKTLDDTEK